MDFRPSFSLAALLMVLVGLAIVGNTIVGGLPDKILALGRGKASTGPSAGSGGGMTLLGPLGDAITGTHL